jgi:hypothetical protein
MLPKFAPLTRRTAEFHMAAATAFYATFVYGGVTGWNFWTVDFEGRIGPRPAEDQRIYRFFIMVYGWGSTYCVINARSSLIAKSFDSRPITNGGISLLSACVSSALKITTGVYGPDCVA